MAIGYVSQLEILDRQVYMRGVEKEIFTDYNDDDDDDVGTIQCLCIQKHVSNLSLIHFSYRFRGSPD